ncbi:hypothetical protein [Oryza sativa Japonica Group]|uniref:DUF834 domain-containing protein n=1 Tax=Oryza sativa subsp. japonica TaxID=39947 RepID=Q5ZCN5_ORYSJ|nr:hypothetical protein [Oryza sativa Japonica Group]BAD52769.1 hypothetical protein [Oryza sativa Japonica Group]BAD54026.1 hypothetical protein [Oryza sativa Japonica Group]BAD54027.1 hypothetical protein [Oryza sativa Japonica Group]
MTGDGKGRVAELPLTTAHPTVVTATGDDDGDGGAAAPEMAGGGGLLGGGGDGTPVTGDSGERAAGLLHPLAHLTVVTELRSTEEDGRGGKRKRRTRGSYL